MTVTSHERLQPDSRLTGWKLSAARVGWLAFFASAVLTLLVAIPARWTQLSQLVASAQARFAALGWTAQGVALIALATELLFIASFLGVGLLIFVRRSDDRMALLASFMLVAFGIGNQTIAPTIGALRGTPAGWLIFSSFGFAAWSTFSIFWYLFPSGHFIPRWTRVTAVIWLLLGIPWSFGTGTRFDVLNWPPLLFFPLTLTLWFSWPVSQAYRYRHLSIGIERQQTKWVVYALATVASVLAACYLPTTAIDRNLFRYVLAGQAPTPDAVALFLGFQTAMRIVFLLIPVAFGLSVLRYGLYEIDLVIRKTLVYSVLTVLLGAVYFGSVVLLQRLFGALTGVQQSPLAVVVSTLVIAALFTSLRQRIQDVIDRRFFRKKYDAQRVLAQFAQTARDETDLDTLTGELARVVQETLQPEGVSVWLKPSGRGKVGAQEAKP